MQLLLYSHCAVGPGGPLAVPPPDCCCFSQFFSKTTSVQSIHVHVLPSHTNEALSSQLSTPLTRNRVTSLLLSLREVEKNVFGVLSVYWCYAGMLASCRPALLLLLLSTIQSCQWS